METPKDNALKIGRDDTTTPALFVHAPRPANRLSGENGYQCRFGADSHWALSLIDGNQVARVTVYRSSERAKGSLDIGVSSEFSITESSLTLTADEMQTLACALLDAAHHLRTVPATPYVASATADAEAVPA